MQRVHDLFRGAVRFDGVQRDEQHGVLGLHRRQQLRVGAVVHDVEQSDLRVV